MAKLTRCGPSPRRTEENILVRLKICMFHVINVKLTSIDHCIDMIRQALMCNSDTGLILYHWVKGKPLPAPNFHTMVYYIHYATIAPFIANYRLRHKCADPEAVLQWSVRNAAKITQDITRLPNAKELDQLL